MYIRLLGPVRVSTAADAEAVSVVVGGAKPQALLVALLSRAGQVVAADTLIDAIWGERPPSSARGMLHTYICGLRGAFAGAGRPGALSRVGGGYRIDVDASELDLARFEALVGQARELAAAGAHHEASEHYAAALALWDGPAFGGLRNGFLLAEAQRLDELRMAALQERVAADLAAGLAAAVVPELSALVREHPLRERFWALLMVALWHSGRQADALHAYHSAAEMLRAELGIDPGTTLRDVYQAILDGDRRALPPADPHQPMVSRTPAPPGSRPTPSRYRPRSRRRSRAGPRRSCRRSTSSPHR